MKVFIPFEEAIVEDLLTVGEAIVPFKIEFDRGRVSWEQVEVLDEAATPKSPNTVAIASVE